MSNRKIYRKRVTRVSVLGSCCLMIFQKARFRGEHQILQPGFSGFHELSSIRSLRFEDCSKNPSPNKFALQGYLFK